MMRSFSRLAQIYHWQAILMILDRSLDSLLPQLCISQLVRRLRFLGTQQPKPHAW